MDQREISFISKGRVPLFLFHNAFLLLSLIMFFILMVEEFKLQIKLQERSVTRKRDLNTQRLSTGDSYWLFLARLSLRDLLG